MTEVGWLNAAEMSIYHTLITTWKILRQGTPQYFHTRMESTQVTDNLKKFQMQSCQTLEQPTHSDKGSNNNLKFQETVEEMAGGEQNRE